MSDGPAMTVEDVAKRLNVSVFAVRRWLRSGRLGGMRLGGTRAGWRITPADIEQFEAEARERGRNPKSEAA